jgi:hypothetical protein
MSKYLVMKQDGSLGYSSPCKLCKYHYIIEYLKKKRQEPESKKLKKIPQTS